MNRAMSFDAHAPTSGPLVLVVDDEEDLCQLVAVNLQDAGFEVVTAATAADALATARTRLPALVVLDVMLPDGTGADVCRALRAEEALAQVGVLMLTAKSTEEDRLLGFEVGADDYVVKPFSVRELVMRARAITRRAEDRAPRSQAPVQALLAWRGLAFDPVGHRVTADGEPLSLRPLEFRLLQLFLENPGRVFGRSELLRDVWGLSPETSTRTVDVHIRRLRERLGHYETLVETVHGFGYRLRDP